MEKRELESVAGERGTVDCVIVRIRRTGGIRRLICRTPVLYHFWSLYMATYMIGYLLEASLNSRCWFPEMDSY